MNSEYVGRHRRADLTITVVAQCRRCAAPARVRYPAARMESPMDATIHARGCVLACPGCHRTLAALPPGHVFWEGQCMDPEPHG